MDPHINIRADETLRRCDDKIVEVIYTYTETQNGLTLKTYNISVARENYEQFQIPVGKQKLSYDRFIKVLRPFMLGKYAADDIPEAFRILDADNSGAIDISELAAYLPVIVPGATPHLLLHHVGKVDSNSDSKLNLEEFTDLINKGIGRDISVGKT